MFFEIKLNKSTFWIFLSVAIGSIVSINATLPLIGIISLYILFFAFVKWEVLFGIGLVGLFTIPYGTYNFFKLKIPYINIDAFTALFYLLLGIVVIKSLLGQKIKTTRLGIFFYVMIFFISIYALIGFFNNQPYFTAEFKIYLLYVIYFLSMLLFSKMQDGLRFMLKITIISSFLLSVLVIFMYFYKNTIFYPLYEGTFYEDGARVAVSNLSLYLISMPLLTFALMFKVLNKNWNILITVTIPLMIISSLIGESRSLIAGLVCNMFLILLLSPLLSRKRFVSNMLLIGFGVMITASIMIIGFTFFSFGETLTAVSERFNEFFQNGTTDSYQTRQNTNAYTMELIKRNSFGYGVGSSMWLINAGGFKVIEGFFIDNGFLTLLYKFGVFGFICFMLFYAINFWNIFKFYRNHKKSIQGKLALIIILCIPAFLANTLYLSAQLVMNGTIFGFLLMIFGLFNTTLETSKNSLAESVKEMT
jgi:O-antigen ligase